MTRLLMKASLLSLNELEIKVLYYAYIRNGGNFGMADSKVKQNEELNKKILDKDDVEQLIKDAVNTALEENFNLYFAKAAKLSLAEDLLYLRNAVDQLVAPLKVNVDDLKKTLEENHLRDVTELRIKQKQLDDKEAELFIAKEEATNLQNQLAMQETEMGRKKEKIKKLELQVDDLMQKLEAKKAEAADLATKLSVSEAKGKDLEKKLSDSEAEAAKLSNDLSASVEKVQGLEQELSDSKAEAEKLSTQLSTSKEKAQELEQELAKVDALLQPYHEIYKAFVACHVFKDLLSQRGINDEEKSSMLKLAEVLGESYTIAGDMYEQIKSAKKENKEPLTHAEGIVYSLLNKYYREHNNIEVDIFTLPGEQKFEQDFIKTDFNKNEQEDLTDPSGAKNRKFAAKVYVPRFNRDNGNMMKKAIVEASNI